MVKHFPHLAARAALAAVACLFFSWRPWDAIAIGLILATLSFYIVEPTIVFVASFVVLAPVVLASATIHNLCTSYGVAPTVTGTVAGLWSSWWLYAHNRSPDAHTWGLLLTLVPVMTFVIGGAVGMVVYSTLGVIRWVVTKIRLT